MAVKLRLKRMGAKQKPFYRIVAADARSPRDGRFIETVGTYNPVSKPASVSIDEEKALKWLNNGAIPTDTVRSILSKEGIMTKSAQNKKYRTTSTEKSVLNYVTDEVNLEDGQSAVSITIPHSNLQTVKYEYDETNKVYKRFARNKAQTDWTSGESLTTKNIIVTMCDNFDLNDGENKGRQTLKNIGTFDGYYLTNGKAIKIKCIKNARDEKTVYKDLQGNEIKVNDGNTWVNICPTDAKIVIE